MHVKKKKFQFHDKQTILLSNENFAQLDALNLASKERIDKGKWDWSGKLTSPVTGKKCKRSTRGGGEPTMGDKRVGEGTMRRNTVIRRWIGPVARRKKKERLS